LAYRVTGPSDVIAFVSTLVSASYDDDVYHPKNTDPSLVGIGNSSHSFRHLAVEVIDVFSSHHHAEKVKV
jgi:hypothetical protein